MLRIIYFGIFIIPLKQYTGPLFLNSSESTSIASSEAMEVTSQVSSRRIPPHLLISTIGLYGHILKFNGDF